MRTSIDIPDDLFRRAKAAAALNSMKFKDLVEEGLRRVLDEPAGVKGVREPPPPPTLFALMQDCCGIVDSGVSDLASNPEHLEGLGRDSLGDR
jgi:hypothetical protein